MFSKAKKIFVGFSILFIVYALLGFFAVPYFGFTKASEVVASSLGSKPSVADVYFNPFTFELEVKQFEMPSVDATLESRARFERFYINFEILNIFKREIKFARIELDNPFGLVHVFSHGLTNWQVQIDEGGLEVERKTEPRVESDKSAWVLVVDKIKVNSGSGHIKDDTLKSPLDLLVGPINLEFNDLKTVVDSRTKIEELSIGLGDSGRLNLAGSMTTDPVSVQVSLKIENMPLQFLTAYLSNSTFLKLDRGLLDLAGNINYQNGGLSFAGDADVKEFKLVHQTKEMSAVEWRSLKFNGIKANSAPLAVSLQDVILHQLKTALTIKKDGNLSLNDFLRQDNKNSKDAQKPENAENKPIDFLLANFSLSDGVLRFTDEQIRPRFSTVISKMSGRFGPFKFDPKNILKLDFNGSVGAHGVAKITGQVKPLAKRPDLNVDVRFSNLEMTTFTPYSGHFAGYEIAKGKLYLNLNYKLNSGKLVGQNSVLLDQFSLGNEVKDGNTTGLPVKLAISLLKDRAGKIKMDLPVEGDTDNPKFSYGGLVGEALVNVITNVALSPFKFLGSLFGGEDLETLSFQEGTADVQNEEQLEKMNNLAKALAERPHLQLEIKGQFQENDELAIKRIRLAEKLKPILLNKKKNREEAIEALAKSTLGSKKINELEEKVDQLPKEERSNTQSLLSKMVEDELLKTIQVSKDELVTLGQERAEKVQSELVKRNIEASRLYVLSTEENSDLGDAPSAHLQLKNE